MQPAVTAREKTNKIQLHKNQTKKQNYENDLEN
jgi:hypothetical protein